MAEFGWFVTFLPSSFGKFTRLENFYNEISQFLESEQKVVSGAVSRLAKWRHFDVESTAKLVMVTSLERRRNDVAA